MLMRNDGRREFCLPSEGQFEEKKRNKKKQPAQVRHQHNNIRNASAQSIFNCISHHFSSDVCTNGSTFKKQQQRKNKLKEKNGVN